MKIVLDSNILFSALISGKDIYLDILQKIRAYTPDFIFIEISKYEERIIKKTKLQKEFSQFVKELFSEIIVFPKIAISNESFEKAYELCIDVDPKDTPYIALSIELDIPLWTNDKKLVEGLRKKGFIKVLMADEIFQLLKKL